MATEFNHCSEVRDTLRNATDNVPRDLCDYMRDRAKTFAPVDTGNLEFRIEANHIGVGAYEVRSTTLDPGQPQKSHSTQRHYAVYVEYGTSKTRAQPYMSPAAAEGTVYAQTLVSELGTRVEQSAASGQVL